MNFSAIELAQTIKSSAAPGMLPADVGARFLGLILPANIQALLPLGDFQGVIESQAQEILPVPQMPPYLLGIVNWRGKSTWVADLGHLLGNDYQTPTAQSKILMIQAREHTIGLLVEQTLSVVNYDANLAMPLDDSLFSSQIRSLLSGYFLDDQHRIWVLLDLPKIFQLMSL